MENIKNILFFLEKLWFVICYCCFCFIVIFKRTYIFIFFCCLSDFSFFVVVSLSELCLINGKKNRFSNERDK